MMESSVEKEIEISCLFEIKISCLFGSWNTDQCIVAKDNLFPTQTSWTPSEENLESSKAEHTWNNNLYEATETT